MPVGPMDSRVQDVLPTRGKLMSFPPRAVLLTQYRWSTRLARPSRHMNSMGALSSLSRQLQTVLTVRSSWARVRTHVVTLVKNRPPHGDGYCPRVWSPVATDCPYVAEAVPGPNSLMDHNIG